MDSPSLPKSCRNWVSLLSDKRDEFHFSLPWSCGERYWLQPVSSKNASLATGYQSVPCFHTKQVAAAQHILPEGTQSSSLHCQYPRAVLCFTLCWGTASSLVLWLRVSPEEMEHGAAAGLGLMQGSGGNHRGQEEPTGGSPCWHTGLSQPFWSWGA